MISYRCPTCGCDDEHFSHVRANAPASVSCRGVNMVDQPNERVERRIENADGTVTLEYEEVEVAPSMEVCGGTALQRESLPGEQFSRPARGFEPLVIYERPGYDTAPPEFKRSHQKYYVPGRNNEPTEPGMRRIDITGIHQYNRVAKEINAHELQKMTDHRDMHREYFGARRKAMREDVDARVGPARSHPLVQMLRRAMRKRSDGKFNARYGKPLDAHFHSQLIEFNQSNMQPWTAEDTGWKDRRAR